MKKILIMFLLTFPILIFAIVSFTSSIIAYYVPIPVDSIQIIEGGDIHAFSNNESYDLKFQIGPDGARNNSFKIYDELNNLLVSYDDSKLRPEIFELSESLVEFQLPSELSDFNNKGLINLKIKPKFSGFTRLLIVTDDGNYEAYSDIFIANPDAAADEIQGVVFDYTNLHSNYRFGSFNNIELGFTYFPKQALDYDQNGIALTEEEKEIINNNLKENAKNIMFNLKNAIIRNENSFVDENNFGRGNIRLELKQGAFIETKELNRNASYSFNVDFGYNVYSYEDLNLYKNESGNLFLLDNIYLQDLVKFPNSLKLYGNNFTINHQQLPYYEPNAEGKFSHVNSFALEFNGNNSGLYDTHIVGPLTSDTKQPFENIINVGFIAKSHTTRYMEAKNNIIENGRMNITVKGFADSNNTEEFNDKPGTIDHSKKATKFVLENNKLVGSYLTAIEVDGQKVEAYRYHSTHLILSKTFIEYTAIGLVIQNARNGSGVSVVTLKNVDNIPAITSTSWRDLDDASGALSMANFGQILKELKSNKYSHVYKKEGKSYYVNPVIMIRGGIFNDGYIVFEDDVLEEQLILETRKPNSIEAMHPAIGGQQEFKIYLLDPIYYN